MQASSPTTPLRMAMDKRIRRLQEEQTALLVGRLGRFVEGRSRAPLDTRADQEVLESQSKRDGPSPLQGRARRDS